MNDLEILVNRKINEYQKITYFPIKEKEIIIRSLKKFLEENKFTFDRDLEEIKRLDEDIENFKQEKRRLKSKYEKYIDINELRQMKLKRDNRILNKIDNNN